MAPLPLWGLMFLLAGGCVEAVFSPAQERQIEDFAQAAMACSNTPGLTVAVVKGNQSWTRGFGQADIERGVNVTSSTLFGVGSISKAFTVTLLAMALNDTQYTWHTSLREILGEDFEMVSNELTQQATLRDILSHRTGLQAANMPLIAGIFEDVSPEDLVRRLKYLKVKFPFRDRFFYNNWMYGLAGHVVEVLSGQSWGEGLQSRLLEPLRMRASRVIGHNVFVNDDVMAKPHVLQDGKWKIMDPSFFNLGSLGPAGAIASSADDMAHWMRFLLRGGQTEDGQSLVDAKLLRDCFQSTVAMDAGSQASMEMWPPKFPISSVTLGYGYGWFKAAYRGMRMLWHSGGLHSYISHLNVFPDQDFAVFTSVNGPYGSSIARPVAMYLTDLLLGHTPFLNHTTACTFPQPWVPPSNVTHDADTDVTDDVIRGSLSPYLGTYGHRLMGDVSIVENSARNGLYFRYGHVEGSLNRTSVPDSFRLHFVGSSSVFSISGSSENKTVSFPIRFQSLVDGHYRSLNMTDTWSSEFHVFSRDVHLAELNGAEGIWGSRWNAMLVLTMILCGLQ